MAEPIALIALALDAAIGWPARLYVRIGHPVGGFAHILTACQRRWNRPQRPRATRLAGCVTLALVMLAGGGTAWLVERAIHVALGDAGWPLVALAAFPALAQRSLYAHVTPVLRALERGDAGSARVALSAIVGRDTEALDEAGIGRAAIESLAESFCDGVAAPLFWLLIFGLPGIWAYKAVNTADSLIGHPEPDRRAFGWASARMDDLANFLPARLCAPLLCLAGMGGWRILWRDRGKHASPNAGWPEAAMAGALGVRLAGPIHYGGVRADKDWIGEGRAPERHDIRRALSIYVRACALLWLIAGGIIWLG
ncbi:adenosylcobinamide-phosphate synthase CbiB [Stakelama tenebrarum]|uniref:Cobalamin biosynthesis protein CobD n=1 Tax=Stakelama tenebrarum TaxID=2711215 RepID=A0A6G6Y2W7_9SPHN|nr:adenosylcobinamide-phosphate synthase CbiB [Sphingosinithalassobacter tenebrarum]QIG79058.1 cobalamin biosynthesis protein CobD [Sphingosinithalassobacter tenebrarum]